jgi:hypothetical protein
MKGGKGHARKPKEHDWLQPAVMLLLSAVGAVEMLQTHFAPKEVTLSPIAKSPETMEGAVTQAALFYASTAAYCLAITAS